MYHGNLKINIGNLKYPSPTSIVGPIVGTAVFCLLLILVLLGVMYMYRRKVIGHKDDINQLMHEMKELEDGIAEDIREGNLISLYFVLGSNCDVSVCGSKHSMCKL